MSEIKTTKEKHAPLDGSANIEQILLESKAYRIHAAVTRNQDVFLARIIKRQEVPIALSPASDSGMYAMYKHYEPTIEELTVEATEVLHGDLVVGATLRFPGNNCCAPDPNASDAVFLHFEDGRMVFSHWKPEEYYLTVPKEAYDWYSSLTEEEVKEFEARFLARLIRRSR